MLPEGNLDLQEGMKSTGYVNIYVNRKDHFPSNFFETHISV